jgi:hypothetical protein
LDIFYAATYIKIGNGSKTSFLVARWVQRRYPKETAPLIFAISKRKFCKVNQAMEDNVWVGKVVLGENFSLEHWTQYVELCASLQEVQLDENADDGISCQW